MKNKQYLSIILSLNLAFAQEDIASDLTVRLAGDLYGRVIRTMASIQYGLEMEEMHGPKDLRMIHDQVLKFNTSMARFVTLKVKGNQIFVFIRMAGLTPSEFKALIRPLMGTSYFPIFMDTYARVLGDNDSWDAMRRIPPMQSVDMQLRSIIKRGGKYSNADDVEKMRLPLSHISYNIMLPEKTDLTEVNSVVKNLVVETGIPIERMLMIRGVR